MEILAFSVIEQMAAMDLTRDELFGLLGRLMRDPVNVQITQEYLADVTRSRESETDNGR